jgi:hypothetical protein
MRVGHAEDRGWRTAARNRDRGWRGPGRRYDNLENDLRDLIGTDRHLVTQHPRSTARVESLAARSNQ